MERINDWLFPMADGAISLAPNRLISLHPFNAVQPDRSTFLDSDYEDEAAVRVLLPSVYNDSWLGVSFNVYIEILGGKVKMELPPNEIEIGLPFKIEVARGMYYLLRRQLLRSDMVGSKYVIYPTEALAEIFKMKAGLHESTNSNNSNSVGNTTACCSKCF